MASSIGISLALIVLLPISNTIDKALNRLHVIYQTSVILFFAGLIVFKLLFSGRNESILCVFIGAMTAVEPVAVKTTLEEITLLIFVRLCFYLYFSLTN